MARPDLAAHRLVVAAVFLAALIASVACAQSSMAPAGTVVYTVNTDANSVSVLDGGTLAQVHADVPTDSLPQAIAVSPDGTRVYTGNTATDLEGRSSVTTIDATTNTPIKTDDFDEGNGITDIALAPSGATIYGSIAHDSRVVAYDPVTSQAPTLDLPDIPPITGGNPDPGAIDVLPDGSAIFVLDAADSVVVKMLTVDGSSPANATVASTAQELRVSADGTTLIVVGAGVAQFFSTDTLAPLAGATTTTLGPQVDVATAGASFYVLDTAWVAPELAPVASRPRGVIGPVPGGPAIDVYTASTGAYVRSIDLGAGRTVLGIAVTSDESTAFVSFTAAANTGSVVAVDLATGTLGPIGATGATPRRVALRQAGPTPVVSYFLPRVVALKLAGAGKDSLVASGFYDDGGLGPDYTQPVTVDVGGFEEVFTLVPNARRTAFKFKGQRLRFAIAPNLRGSSRGRFRMRIAKTTLGGLIDPAQAVDFHFRATGLPDAQGRVVLTGGRYRLGKKRGALILPPFFPARATATLRAANLDTLSFKGGFATNGTTPASLGTVQFAFGSFAQMLEGSAFTKAGDQFKYAATQGKTKVAMVIDFLRETVTLKASKVELGDVANPTADFLFDAGAGAGPIRNTVRLGAKGAKRFY